MDDSFTDEERAIQFAIQRLGLGLKLLFDARGEGHVWDALTQPTLAADQPANVVGLHTGDNRERVERVTRLATDLLKGDVWPPRPLA